MNITGSQYEKEMKRIPRQEPPAPNVAPRGYLCRGCPYWRGIKCVSCYRKMLDHAGR